MLSLGWHGQRLKKGRQARKMLIFPASMQVPHAEASNAGSGLAFQGEGGGAGGGLFTIGIAER